MSESIIIAESNSNRVTLNGDRSGNAIVINKIQIKRAGVSADLEFSNHNLTVPLILLEKTGGEYKFKPDPLNEAVNAAREELRKLLAAPIELDEGAKFFGATGFLNTQFKARVQLNIPDLDAGAPANNQIVLIATASAETTMSVNGINFSAGVSVQVKVDSALNPFAGFLLDKSSLRGFKLHLEEINFNTLKLMDLKFNFLKDALPMLSHLSLPFVGKLEFSWATTPVLDLTLKDDRLSISTSAPASGVLKINGEPLVTVSDFKLDSEQKFFKVTATVTSVRKTLRIIDSLVIENDAIPFNIRLVGVEMEVGEIVPGKPFDLTIKVKIELVEIRAKTDPSLVLGFAAEFEIKAQEGAELTTKLTRLDLINPSELELIRTAEEHAGNLIRLVTPVGLEERFKPLLNRMAEMLAAAAKWFSERLGQAAGILAGVAESISRVLAEAFNVLRQSPLLSKLYLEVCLDPRDYHLVQILVTGKPQAPNEIDFSQLGFDFKSHTSLNPALVLSLSEPAWFGIALQDSAQSSQLSLGTDLWLSTSKNPTQALKDTDPKTGNSSSTRLITVTATLKKKIALVPIAIQKGRVLLFQKITPDPAVPSGFPISVGGASSLTPASLNDDVTVSFKSDGLQERLLALLPKPKTTGSASSFLESLDQYVKFKKVESSKTDVEKRVIAIDFVVAVIFSDEIETEAKIKLTISLDDFSAKLEGERISIFGTGRRSLTLFGLNLVLTPKTKKDGEVEEFFLDLSQGREKFGLGQDVDATLAFGKLGGEGRGLVFKVEEFLVGRNGLDLSATTIDEPVTLGGINMPFRFKSGSISIKNSKFRGGTLTGNGQLPPALIGEANVTISLALGADENGSVRVISADCKLDKSNDPIVCESTRFRFSLSKVELSFVEERGYHFYFLLTGSARFTPGPGEFTSGLLKHLGDLEIVLDRAPLAADPKVLARAINFQIKVNPPKRTSFFDLFEFELRGIGFHPSAAAFDGAPALSISGQVNFAQFGDIVSPNFDFHKMWIAPPAAGKSLPRIRFDGLGVGLKLGAMAEVYGTAMAVDEKLPDLFSPDVLPANVTANGFLASGRLAISGWASMSAAMGFLELRERTGDSLGVPQFAFFFYGQANLLSEKIPTPVGPIYLREVGFGFGWRYTLAGIAAVETLDTPQQLIQTLDEISKFQGSLDKIQSWRPTFNKPTLTLAMRALFTIASVSTSSHYDKEKEKDLPNPLLFDVVAAIRSDLTFLINARAWLSVNYADWYDQASFGSASERPSLRGYIYLSVPKQMFLGRFVGDPTGHIGKHPPLPPNLLLALQNSDYSATLFIRPGLFHFELGWPFELKVHFGQPSDNFFIQCSGGLVLRIEDGAMLQGFAFRGQGFARLGGSRGGSFGASAVARADFSIEGKLLAYVSLRRKEDSMFYGSFRLDVHIQVGVHVWFEFKVFGRRIRWETGFEFGLTVALAIEVALLADGGLGARIHAAVGVQAFGRSLTLGIELKFNDHLLGAARSRVARFLSMGLGTQVADESAFNRPPVVESSRRERALQSDKQIVEEAQSLPPVPTTPIGDKLPEKHGVQIAASDFWAMLYPTNRRNGDGEFYIMQLIPKDFTDVSKEDAKGRSTFYAPPLSLASVQYHHAVAFPAGVEVFELDSLGKVNKAPLQSKMNLDRHVFESEDEVFTLKEILEPLFMGAREGEKEKEPYSDPPSVIWKREKTLLNTDQEAATRALQKASRERNGLKDTADTAHRTAAEIEERRSAVIGIIGSSAAALAAAGEHTDNQWEQPAEVNALDFGLTYLIDRKNLDRLFRVNQTGPRESDIKIKKVFRIGGASPETEAGKVHLFNPPERMFREAVPKLADPNYERSSSGVTFCWNLEPAWDSSASLYDDPEFHLRHYKIVRFIQGLPNDKIWKTTLDVKPSAPVQTGLNGQEMLSSGIQFVDDLSSPPDFPKDLRETLLGITTNPEEWETLGLGNSVTISYQIVAVDVAGTTEPGTAVDIKIDRPIAKFSQPKEVGVVVTKSVEAPTAGKTLGDSLIEPSPTIRFRIRLDKEPRKGIPLRFKIKVTAADPLPVGQYGGDSLTVALEDTDQSVLAHSPDKEAFILDVSGLKTTKPFPTPGKDQISVLVEWPGASGKLESGMAIGKFSLPSAASLGAKTPWQQFAETSGFLLSPSYKPQAHRFFFQQIPLNDDETESSTWSKATVEMIYGLRDREPAIQAVFEEFEAPISLNFKPIQRVDFTRVEAGRLHFLIPAEDSTFDGLLPGHQKNSSPNMKLVRDPDRRTAINLRWLARPEELALIKKPNIDLKDNLWRLIGGFTVQEILSEPRELFKVSLLPSSLKGKEPAELGDLGRIHASYPTDALRERLSGSLRKSPWFSTAESVPVWPERVLRRSLMTAPDESVISALFAKGTPAKIRVTLQSEFLKAFTGTLELGFEVSSVYDSSPAPEGWSTTFKLPKDQLQPHDLRAILQHILIKPTVVGSVNFEYANRPDPMSGATIVVSALDKANTVLVTQNVGFDAAPSLHPVLADTLDFIHYAPFEGKEFDSRQGRDLGKAYRRYEIVADPGPEISAKTFEEWIDSAPADRDPYGWGVLRTLGLANGFRVFDTETGEFLSGGALLKKVQTAFGRALARYMDLNVGSPFVDLVAEPWGTAKIFSFDGGFEDRREDESELINDGLLAVVQISLRPRVDQIEFHTRPDGKPDPNLDSDWCYSSKKVPPAPNAVQIPSAVRYWKITVPQGAKELTVTVPAGPEANARFDLHLVEQSQGISAEQRGVISNKGPNLPNQYVTTGNQIASSDVFVRSIWFGDVAKYPKTFTVKGKIADEKDRNKEKEFVVEPERIDMLLDKLQKGLPEAKALAAFDPLAADYWGALCFSDTASNSARQSLTTLSHWAIRRFPATMLPTEEPKQKSFLSKLVLWAERFLRYGGANATEVSDQKIKFSLATMISQPEWRVPVASDGTVGVFLADESGYGFQRRFVVQPFGRYEAFVKALEDPDSKIVEVPNLNFPATVFADVTVPRTAPVAKPVVLSAKRLRSSGRPGVLELIVSRTGDEILAEANQTTEAGLAANGISVSFFREFPFKQWGTQFLSGRFNPNAQFGNLKQIREPAKITLTDVPAIPSDELSLSTIPERVPDAWLGAWILRMPSLPYFYRVHALVHANAGVVISEQAAATFEEGIFETRWPHKSLREPAPRAPRYSVSRFQEDDKAGVKIRFDVPLISFADCMIQSEPMVTPEPWFDNASDEFLDLAFLPDPAITYKLLIESVAGGTESATAEPLSRTSHFDFLASPTEDGTKGAYLVQSAGSPLVMTPPAAKDEPLRINASRIIKESPINASGIETMRRWEITPQLELATSSDKPKAFDPFPLPGQLVGFVVKPEHYELWRPFAPLGTATLVITKPANEGKWQDLAVAVDSFSKYPVPLQFLKVLNDLKEIIPLSPAERDRLWLEKFGSEPHEFTVEKWVLGLPQVPIALGTFKVPLFSWPRNLRVEDCDREHRSRVETALGDPAENPNKTALNEALKFIRVALREHFIALNRSKYPTNLSPIFREAKGIKGFENVHFDELLNLPFDSHAEFQYSPPPGPLEAPWKANFHNLFKCVEKSHFSGDTIRTLGVIEDHIDSKEVWPLALSIPGQVLSCARDLLDKVFTKVTGGTRAAVLRVPPEDNELKEMLTKVSEAEVEIAYKEMTAEQLFGPGRRPVLSAVRATDAAMMLPIVRKES